MRRTFDSRVALLEMLPMFDGCSKKQLARVARAADEIDIPSGEVVVREGQPGHHFYVLAEGLARVSVGGRRLGSVRPGSFFGEMAILDHGTRAATVETALPCRMLVLDGRQFRQLLADAPGVAQRIMRGMANRLRDVERDLGQLSA
jgi:CRP/FNR family transcriptional regulator, cyclic AMP receptor protein